MRERDGKLQRIQKQRERYVQLRSGQKEKSFYFIKNNKNLRGYKLLVEFLPNFVTKIKNQRRNNNFRWIRSNKLNLSKEKRCLS